jgi:cob(I)alamin adenosyltransferase
VSEHIIDSAELDGNNPYIAEHIHVGVTNDIRIGHDRAFVEKYGATDEVWLSIGQFLTLLDWGQENRTALERLAKE